MSKKWWWMLAVVAILIGAGAYVASPFLAYRQLQLAAQSGDRDRLEQVVDFPAVRDSLKSQLSAEAMQSIGSRGGSHNQYLAALGGLLARQITDGLVDSIVTPDGVAMLIQEGRLSKSVGGRNDAASGSDNGAPGNGKATVAYGYSTADRFRVTVTRNNDPSRQLGLTLERRGLFSWKLIRIDLPPGLFERRSGGPLLSLEI